MRLPTHPAIAFVFMLALPGTLAGARQQPLTVSRERSVLFDMRRETVQPHWLATCPTRPGMRQCIQVLPPNRMEVLRLHLALSGAASGRWRIHLRDHSGTRTLETLDDASGALQHSSVWTDRVPAGAQVQVWADAGAVPASVSITEVAYLAQPATNQAIHGIDGRIKIEEAPEAIRRWAGAVARLRIMGPEGQAHCTGFLLSNTLVMTNHHCVRTEEEARSTIAEFGYEVVGGEVDRHRGSKLGLNLERLDYALVRLADAPARKWMRLRAADAVEPTDRLLLTIVQHPLGGYKQASIEGCEVSGASVVGAGDELSDFGHECDTLTGSSGSPVVDRASGQLVGLHHWGFADTSPNPVNQAVRFALILRDIRVRNPQIYREILAAR